MTASCYRPCLLCTLVKAWGQRVCDGPNKSRLIRPDVSVRARRTRSRNEAALSPARSTSVEGRACPFAQPRRGVLLGLRAGAACPREGGRHKARVCCWRAVSFIRSA